MTGASERISSQRAEVIEELNTRHNLGDDFGKMTEEERQAGRLIGALMTCMGNESIENTFEEHELATGKSLSWFEKMLALSAATMQLGCNDQRHYNAVRKIFVTMNT